MCFTNIKRKSHNLFKTIELPVIYKTETRFSSEFCTNTVPVQLKFVGQQLAEQEVPRHSNTTLSLDILLI